HRRRFRVRYATWATSRKFRRSPRLVPDITSPCIASPAHIDLADRCLMIRNSHATPWRFRMKSPFRSLLTAALAMGAWCAAPAFAAKEVVFAVASTFTTTDPYDANDTLSQAMAKSFYEGLFGFDKDMHMVPVLAESYDDSK